MTLEDFFTLTEMKDGLTAPARVEELVSVMKKEKDSSVKNFADATRQWAAVAGAIAATENKECLDLFIQLDGLWFIDRWLKDVQSFTPESSDCSVEETISALLQAIERLEIENERLVSSGICITVKDLLSYKSSKVQDRARALFDSWGTKDADVTSMDVDKAVAESDQKLDSGQLVSCAGDVLPKLVSVLKVESGEKTNDQDGPQVTSNHADSKDECPNSVPSPVKLESVQASVSARVGGCSSDGNADKQHLSDTKEGTDEALSKVLRPEHLVEDATHDNKNESVPDRSGAVHGPPASDSIDSVSKTNAMGGEEPGVKTDLVVNDAKETLSIKCSSDNDIDRPVAESRNSVDESGGLEHKGLDHAEGSSVLEETKDQGANISRLDEADGCKEAKKHSKGKSKRKNKNKSKYFGGTCEFARLTKHTKDADTMRQTADMDLENGIVDALEVARLVANEVEREVVGYYEQSGSSSNSSSSSSSSSESTSRGSTGEPSSPESINGGQENQNVPTNELPSVESMSPETSEKGALTSSGNQDQKLENHAQELESSQVTDAVREPENNADNKNVCAFDLNQEFSSEDPDRHHHNHQVVEAVSNAGASFVSASRAIAAPGMMPGAPLQFEGVLGWKGSAATSAFRPAASPRQASDSDRALSGGGTSSGSRHRQDFLDIDLNVAEEEGGDDNKVVNPMLAKQKLTLLPGLPSGESSVELSPKRTTERLRFDLNQMGDGDVPSSSEWKIGGQVFGAQNSRRSPSPASSSCIQPSMRDFDLNDNPASHTPCNDLPRYQQPFLGESSSSQKIADPYARLSDDSVISILGTKVGNKNAFPPQTPVPFMNGGRASEPVVDNAAFLRGGPLVGLGPAVPYGHSIYSYNGLAMGPAVPFPSGVMYGPGGPYVLDPRGPAVIPQLVGTASTIPSSYGQQPSLVMNLMGPGPGPAPPVSNTAGPFSNAMGPFRPSLDLNPAGYAVEGGSRDASSFYRPVFFQTSQSRPPREEQHRDNFFRPLSSSGGKRKEPETGWELFPTNYKHHQPPPPPPYL